MPKQQSETVFRNEVHRELSKRSVTLFRNNQGMAWSGPVLQHYRDGSVLIGSAQAVRYGVCNPGGSDLIGWTPRIIMPDMIGLQFAIFTAIETKVGKRKATDEQANFLCVLKEAGGIAVLSRELDVTIEEVCGGK